MNEETPEESERTASAADDSLSEVLRDLASDNCRLYLDALIDCDADDESIITNAPRDLRPAAILPTPHAVSTYVSWLRDVIGFPGEKLLDEIHKTLFDVQRLTESTTVIAIKNLGVPLTDVEPCFITNTNKFARRRRT